MFRSFNLTVNSLLHFLTQYSYWCVFLGLLLENVLLIGFIVPGLTILLMAGFLASTGEIDPVKTVLWGTLGTLMGDTINFSFGRYGLARLSWGQRQLTRHSRVVSFVREASPRLFFFYHFPGYLRTFFPMVMGSMRYPVTKWIWIELCGAPLFNATFVMAGWIAGRATQEVVSALDLGTLMVRGVLILSTVWLLILAFRLRRVWRRGGERADSGEKE